MTAKVRIMLRCNILRYFHKLTFVLTLVGILIPLRHTNSQPVSNTKKGLKFQSISYKDGLSSNRIFNIVKDSQGYMWFATENGIVRFDGQEMKNYFNNPSDSTAFFGNSTFAFLVTEGKLLIGNDMGLMLYNENCNNFKRIRNNNEPRSIYYVTDIDKAYNNDIIVTSPSMILSCNPTTWEMTSYLFPDTMQIFQKGEACSQAFLNPLTTEIWIATNYRFIVCSYPKSEFRYINHNCGRIRKCHSDIHGNIWIGSTEGLFLLNTKDGSTKKITSTDKKTNEILSKEIWDIAMDNSNNLWIATIQDGLVCFNVGTGKSVQFVNNKNDEQSINTNNIRSVYIDNQGILWIGTQYSGINYAYLYNPKKFNSYDSFLNPTSSSSEYSITAVLKDSDSNLWLGTEGSGLFFIDGTDNHVIHYSSDNTNITTSNAILTIFQDSRKNIWIGGYEGKIDKFIYKEKKWVHFAEKCQKKGCTGLHDVRQFVEDSEGTIWIATNGHGLFACKPNEGKFIFFNTLNSGLVNDHVLRICESVDKKCLWIGTYNGLCFYNRVTKSWKQFAYVEGSNHGLSNNWIYSLYCDKKNRIWVGTAFGLDQYNPETSDFTNFFTNDGLPGNSINGILEDENGKLWIATNNGITQFDPDRKKYRNFYMEDGLPGNEFNHGASFKSSDGELFFGSVTGMVSFYPNLINYEKYISPVVISDVLIFYKSISQQLNCRMHGNDKAVKKLVLTHKQSTVTFNYTALNFTNAKNNNFLYKLEGYDKEWIEAGKRREATYTNLDPGNYLFTVIGCNNDNIWDTKGDSIELTILSPWWATWYSRLLLVLTVLFLIIGSYNYRLRSIIRQKQKLENLVNLRTAELETKNNELSKKAEELNNSNLLLEKQNKHVEEQSLELVQKNDKLKELNQMNERIFSIIAHDLKNPFNALLGLTDILTDHPEEIETSKKQDIIQHIRSAITKVLELTENLLMWSSSNLKGINYNPVYYNLNEQIVKNINFIKDYSSRKSITIHYNPMTEIQVFADYNMIDAVLRNIISNSIKYSNSKGKIYIEINKKDKEVICSVKDEGVGMDTAEISTLFKFEKVARKVGTMGEQGSGLGLAICYDFIVRNKGRIYVESKLDSGTTFFISLPNQNEKESY